MPVTTYPHPLDLPAMPRAFRLVSARSSTEAAGAVIHVANLFHESASLRVCWSTSKQDSRAQPGALVSPRWLGKGESRDGCLLIARLVPLTRPTHEIALFDTVPPGWFAERTWIRRAAALLADQPVSYRHLFNAILWDGDRFRRFCRGPSSLHDHHHGDGDNLRHTVETAEYVRQWCMAHAFAHKDLGVLTALLHDAGKADEYRRKADGTWGMSDRGRLLGHKITVIEWVAAALAQWNIRLPPTHAEALMHNLSAAAHAPRWLGLREPQTLEAEIVSLADRLSGRGDLVQRCLPDTAGWGAYHAHLGHRPYRPVPTADTVP